MRPRCCIVPAIDLLDGKCVRLTRGDYNEREVVGDDPVTVAQTFQREGFSRLHLVDLAGARAGSPVHLQELSRVAEATQSLIDWSGGVRTSEDARRVFAAGATQLVVGSAAVKQPEIVEEWLREFGPERIIIGLDILNGSVRIQGWEVDTALSFDAVIERFLPLGLATVMSTDISRDGTLAGVSPSFYEKLTRSYPTLRIVASGGVATADDVKALADVGVAEVIVGKALYAGSVDRSEVREFIW